MNANNFFTNTDTLYQGSIVMPGNVRQVLAITQILKSPQLEAILVEKAHQIEVLAATDPNSVYVTSLDVHTFTTDRVVAQVGAAPHIGTAVEAKRGTLAKALARVGA
jgi:hypothetical protein